MALSKPRAAAAKPARRSKAALAEAAPAEPAPAEPAAPSEPAAAACAPTSPPTAATRAPKRTSRSRPSADPLAGLQSRIGHTFRNKALIEQALRHRSFGADNNERLEFLGDAVLNASIGHLLFMAMPDVPEGELSRLRAQLVRQESLHQIALGLELPSVVRLGEGEARSGGAQRPSILADALEAIIGAVYLDAGFDQAHALVRQLFSEVALAPQTRAAAKDAKTELQEWLQARKKALPAYTISQVTGAAHEQTFEVECRVAEPELHAKATGRSRRAAEQAAAARVLDLIRLRFA